MNRILAYTIIQLGLVGAAIFAIQFGHIWLTIAILIIMGLRKFPTW
jgi:hypothetical protein